MMMKTTGIVAVAMVIGLLAGTIDLAGVAAQAKPAIAAADAWSAAGTLTARSTNFIIFLSADGTKAKACEVGGTSELQCRGSITIGR